MIENISIQILKEIYGGRQQYFIYLIPKNYQGKVNIIFNQTQGDSIKYEKGCRVYVIPENGILLTNFKDQYGKVDRKYYYLDESGNRESIDIILPHDNNTKKGVLRDGTVGVYGNSDEESALFYQEFYITNKDELDNYFSMTYQNEFNKKIVKIVGHTF